jgi:hypothetical protein
VQTSKAGDRTLHRVVGASDSPQKVRDAQPDRYGDADQEPEHRDADECSGHEHCLAVPEGEDASHFGHVH